MPRIPYRDYETIDDPEIVEILDRARRVGTPRPESQAIRAHVPAVAKTFSAAWQETFVDGVVDHDLKELSATPPEVLEAFRARTPIGRLVEIDDVAHATEFLLENGAVNAVNLNVDGGWLAS